MLGVWCWSCVVSVRLFCGGILSGIFRVHYHDTSLQDGSSETKAFSYPTGVYIVALESVQCVFCKKTGVFGPIFAEKSPFSHIMMIGTFCRLVCPLNEGNDGHLCSFSLTIALIQVI
jgi:hypothetical protein